ncbi:hypothetical protein HMPREF9078_02489, partial [Capnocytophaga sp. oral taxon 380 str. F0488]
PYSLFSPKSLPPFFRIAPFSSDSSNMSLLGVYTLPKLIARRATTARVAHTACAARTSFPLLKTPF